MISDDLVNSYHLLLCALDLVYCNALLCSSRKDLLNPAFKGPTHTAFILLQNQNEAFDLGSAVQTVRSNKHWFVFGLCAGLPEDFNSKDYKPGPGSLCFIEKLCELHDGLVLEAKGAKEHFWKPFIKKLFERKVLEILQTYNVD